MNGISMFSHVSNAMVRIYALPFLILGDFPARTDIAGLVKSGTATYPCPYCKAIRKYHTERSEEHSLNSSHIR